MEKRQRHQNKGKEQLVKDEDDDDGISNPSLDLDTEKTYQSFLETDGKSSFAELVEKTAEANDLVKDLKSRRRQRKKSLSKLNSPKEDVGAELTTMRNLSHQHLDEVIQNQQQLSVAGKAAPVVSDIVDQNFSFVPHEEKEPLRSEAKESDTCQERDANDKDLPAVDKESTLLDKSASMEESLKQDDRSNRQSSSLRARMRDRLQKAKEEAEGEIEKEAREERKRQRNLRENKGIKFDEINEAEIERATAEKAHQLRLRWQRMGQIISEKDALIPSAEDALDFFARVWEQEPEENKLKEEEVHPEASSQEISEVRKAEGDEGEELKVEAPLQRREDAVKRLRFLEDEGFYWYIFSQAVVCEYDNRYIDGVVDGSGNYQLDVDINSIIFSHHHLFSHEHVLAMRLNQLYRQYALRSIRNLTVHLMEKLHALKMSAAHLQDYILSHKGEMSVSDRTVYEKRLQDYKFEIRQTRSLRDQQEHMDRALLKNIIRTWKEIKSLREQYCCTTTTVRLKVISEAVDKTQDQLKWQQEIEEEVTELKEEHEEEYSLKMRLYKEQMDKWEKTKVERDQNNEQYTSKDEKPEPPKEFDENAVREQIKAKLMSIRRRPGEPKLFPELTDTFTITPTQECPRSEQERRDAVSKCKLFVKILFNNKEVSRTGTRPLSQDFKVNFGQIFNLRIIQWPESIKFQIFESQGISTHLLAELYAAIPEVSITSQSVHLEDMEFSSDEKILFGHGAVGSGVPFKFDATSTMLVTLMTSGTLSTSVAWAVNDEGKPLVPPSGQTAVTNAVKQMDPVAAIGATGVVNLRKLAKWFQESRMDPNDPVNADLVYLLEPKSKGDGSCSHFREYFRLEQLQEEFDVTTENDLRFNRRFQLLLLRDRDVAEFRHSKLVPLYEREIPRDAFTEYEKKHREKEHQRHGDDIEATRQAHSKYIQKIREQMIMRFRIASHQKRLEDMVIEEGVPNIVMLGISLLRLSEPRRPLKPLRKERKRVTAQAIKGDEVRLLVNSHIWLFNSKRYRPKAWYFWRNLFSLYPSGKSAGVTITRGMLVQYPDGAASFPQSPQLQNRYRPLGDLGKVVVHPYVEVMFQHNTVRTSAGEGPNPSFNEELELSLKAPNDDFSPSVLQTISDYIYLNLFDEVVVDILEDERQRETAVHQRLEKKWLGNIKIPFSTVYLNGKIDGTFRINTPSVLLGYTYDINQEQVETGAAVIQEEKTTSLSLFITIEPPLSQPEPMRERFDTNENENLMQYADKWQQEIEARFPKRHYKTSVIDVNGKNVFLTRFFRALKPPPEILEKATESAQSNFTSRYVSLIPFVSDAVVFPGLCDIWSTCDQFLQMLAGDEEEHALLLTNLFLGLGKKAWLLLGSAIPEGPTAYVLTEESDGFYLWNSASSKRFSVNDSYCPLHSVGCLVNQENIWANISRYEKPAQIDFNINNTTYWRPFFDRSYQNPRLGTIQPEALIYHPYDKGYILDLQEKIEQLLKNKIMEWRSHFITRWNRHCTQIMRKLLPRLEENCGQAIDHQELGELEESFKTYKVSGFPLNVPFVDLNSIVEAVYSTGVHSQETSNTEFALAVYVHGYSNSVLSVWIYVASLNRSR
ncbi:hypothetical protein C0Q70_16675 [Pomacea canaliculata]|uniref:Uncharacterized protein n=1 Tax=Pomacea canaliculata TaxID=400727 RepID=A0A2T7NQH3_POMCA|nr:hypothetical protein C0Q70_16675 [Pomacea canaliculata]